MSDKSLQDLEAYGVLVRVSPESVWEITLFIGGVMQLIGLRFEKPVLRAVGAALILYCFMCIFIAVVSTDPGTRALGLYLAAMFIEFCAIVYQTARIVRTGGLIRWPLMFKR